jgi:alkaline phosphatase D
MLNPVTRRSLFKQATAAVSLLTFSDLLGASHSDDTLQDWHLLPRGVASGDPTATSVVIWAGLPPSRLNESLVLKWEISTSPDFSRITQRGKVSSSPMDGGNAQVHIKDLKPATQYYYRFFQEDLQNHGGFESGFPYQSRLGRTKTLSLNPSHLNFSFLSCFDFTNGHFTALSGLMKQNCDFVISLGDNIYETGSAIFQKKNIRSDNIGGGTAVTLNDYRHKYQLYLTDKNLRDARAWFPWFTLWDDHEFFNNFPGYQNPNDLERRTTAYSNGRRAFYEYNPISIERKEQTFFKRSFGNLAEIFFLDQRSFRSAPPCLDTMSFGCKAMEDESRTMLGSVQLDWFQSEITQSTAQHKIIANETMMMPMRLMRSPELKLNPHGPIKSFRPQLNGLYANLDSWDGFPAERQKILNTLQDNFIEGVVFCTGDIHTGIAGRVHLDAQDAKDSPVVAHEIVTPSVTSATFADFTSEKAESLVKTVLKAVNSHYDFIDTRNHGFVQVLLQSSGVNYQQISPQTVSSSYSSHMVTHTGMIFKG